MEFAETARRQAEQAAEKVEPTYRRPHGSMSPEALLRARQRVEAKLAHNAFALALA